jgi:hypothetical protein
VKPARQLRNGFAFMPSSATAMLWCVPATFVGENEGARLNRRKRNWIADVQFEAIS